MLLINPYLLSVDNYKRVSKTADEKFAKPQ